MYIHTSYTHTYWFVNEKEKNPHISESASQIDDPGNNIPLKSMPISKGHFLAILWASLVDGCSGLSGLFQIFHR